MRIPVLQSCSLANLPLFSLAVSFAHPRRRVREYLVQRWRLKARLNYRYGEGDVEWNPKNTLRYPAVCFFAGFFAGLFGVGGGIVKGPLMLEMGERQRQRATEKESKEQGAGSREQGAREGA